MYICHALYGKCTDLSCSQLASQTFGRSERVDGGWWSRLVMREFGLPISTTIVRSCHPGRWRSCDLLHLYPECRKMSDLWAFERITSLQIMMCADCTCDPYTIYRQQRHPPAQTGTQIGQQPNVEFTCRPTTGWVVTLEKS